MFRRSYWALGLISFLAVALLAAACQPAAPAPTKPAAREPVNITIHTASAGSGAYLVGNALADIMNKNHPWLRGTALEALGGVAGMKTVIQADPETRKRSLSFSSDLNVYEAREGIGPFKDMKYPLTVLSNAYAINAFMISVDPKIRTKEDLVGKRIATGGPKGSSRSQLAEFFIAAWGLSDKVRLEYMDIMPSKDALLDGVVVSMLASAFTTPPGTPYSLDPSLVEIKAQRPFYILPLSEEDWKKGQAATKQMWGYGVIPKDVAYSGIPDKDTGIVIGTNSWFVPAEMDPEITYEIAKLITENYQKFGEYAAVGKALFPEIQAVGIYTEDVFHPGALKWYKEKGLKIGR